MTRNNAKFTLIEMLVVIAVISILASLLMPALGKSLAAARDLRCLNHMKQVGALLHAYFGDFGGRSPAARTRFSDMPAGYNTPSYTSYYYWQHFLMPYYESGATIVTNYKDTVSAGGYTLNIPKGVFACPSVSISDILSMNTYGFRVNGKMAIAANHNCCAIQTARITRPSATFMLMDMLGDSGTDQAAASNRLYSWNGTPMWLLSYGIPPRHGSGSCLNAGFFDAHATPLSYDSIPDTGGNQTGKWDP